MIQQNVEDVKGFIHLLLCDPFFDGLEMVRLELQTAVTRTVDGKIRKEFYDDEGKDRGEYILWGEEKAGFADSIRGKIRPLRFRIVFRYPDQEAMKLPGNEEGQISCFLNVNYDRQNTLLTTGIAEKEFRPGAPGGREWDAFVQNVIRKLGIA